MNTVKSLMRAVLGKRLPITEGSLEVTGVSGTVRIGRDAYGVAYVDAGSDADAWFGLGFAHGQDRAFQLESILRLVRGTLSELIGPRHVAPGSTVAPHRIQKVRCVSDRCAR